MNSTACGFEFEMRTRILFGWGSLSSGIGEVARLFEGRALVVTDPGVATSGVLERVLDTLKAHRLPYVVYDKVSPNPTAGLIDAGENLRRAEGCEFIIGVGGGSSLDTAKGIGILATSGGRITDFAGAGKVSVPPAPVVAIPTTAGTGAEVSTAIAATNEGDHTKFAVRAPLVSPGVAILDPALLETLPQKVAVDSSMDALCHLIEAYVSRGATPLTDLLALEGIKRCGRWLTAFVADRTNPRAAENMLYAALLGGVVISHARTGGAHTLTRAMGDRVSHGMANAVVLPFVMEFNLAAATGKFVEVARALGRPVQGFDISAAEEAVVALRRICRELGVPERLREVGFEEEEIGPMADAAYRLEISKLNPRDLEQKDIEALLQQAF